MNHKLLCWLLAGWPLWIGAEALTDGSVGPVQSLTGQFTVPQALGALRGANLFHSFQTFNINSGESATFTGADGIQNVISRVTGPSFSTINGPLISKVGQADFYFINPNGVLFGPGASLDVPAAFKVSTASELRFPGGVAFSAANPQGSGLSSERPESFGFLGNQSAQIIAVMANMQAKPGAAVELVGRSVDLLSATVAAPAGAVRLEGVGGGDHAAPVDAPSADAHGAVNIQPYSQQSNASTVDVSGNGGGRITVRGGAVAVTGGGLFANNTGSADAGAEKGVDIAADSLALGNAAQIRTNVLGAGRGGTINIAVAGQFDIGGGSTVRSSVRPGASGRGGNIAVTAGGLGINGAGGINTSSVGAGAAGDVNVSVGGPLALRNSGFIASNAADTGAAGNVAVAAGSIDLDGGSIDADAFAGSSGNAGRVTVKADGALNLRNNAYISADTLGTGRAGRVTVEAKSVDLDRSYISADAVKATASDAGQVTVTAAGAANLRNGAFISAGTEGSGEAGQVDVSAGSLALSATSLITGGNTSGAGGAGRVGINVDGDFSMQGRSIISVKSGSKTTRPDAGIAIDAGSFSMAGGSAIDVGSPAGSTADAGSVAIKAGTINIDHAYLFNTAQGSGHAGSVALSAGGTLRLTNQSTITTQSILNGNAGAVNIAAKQFEFDENSKIYSFTLGAGQGGPIHINAATIRWDSGAQISSQSLGSIASGRAGDIVMTATDSLSMGRGSRIDSLTEGSGNAGNITVSAGTMALSNAVINASSTKGSGNGGDIMIAVDRHLDIIGHDSAIGTLTMQSGQGGNINISADTIRLDDAGIGSFTTAGSTGRAGDIAVTTRHGLEISNHGLISAGTEGTGRGGNVTVQAENLTMRQLVNIGAHAGSGSTGDAGDVSVQVGGKLDMGEGSFVRSNTEGAGDAGTVKVSAREIAMHGDGLGAFINSAAWSGSSGDGGDVQVEADNITIRSLASISADALPSSLDIFGNANVGAFSSAIVAVIPELIADGLPSATGKAGNVSVIAHNNLSLADKAAISATTAGVGRGGNVTVQAGNLSMRQAANIGAQAVGGSTGDAGDVNVQVSGKLDIGEASLVGSSTQGAGDAGTVKVRAGQIDLHGSGASINSAALPGASGDGGDVQVEADTIAMRGSANISAETAAGTSGKAGDISVTAHNALGLVDGAAISSTAKGSGDAGSVNVQSGNLLLVDSAIATAAQDGDGGPINIQGGQWLWLKDSQITTSVLGQSNGNGGDITLAGGYLVMQTGFIQANTAAPRASGGNIHLRVDGLIPSGGSLLLGGDEIVAFAPGQFGRNIIQAAAPNGIGGILDLGGLQLDLNSAISKLHTAPLDVSSLLPDYCRLGVGSSFTRAGRGGLPPKAGQGAWVAP